MTSPSPDGSFFPEPGATLDGKYRIERVLGRGGMGAVVQATHLLRRAPVAIKFISPGALAQPGVAERFLNEGVAISRMDCEHVVKVFDVSRLPSGSPYLVMEYLEGVDLARLLARDGNPWITEVGRATHFILQALRALQVAHRAGIIHRDMKPANCFVVRKDDEADFVKLLDFGISKVLHSDALDLTEVTSALGTPLYMSPEQAKSPRSVDTRTDLYSVGVILFELLTGGVPFNSASGSLGELLHQIFTVQAPDPRVFRSDLRPELCVVIARALAKEPDDRFQTASQMAEALAPFADLRSTEVLRRLVPRTGADASQPPAVAARSSAPAAVTEGAAGASTPAPPAQHPSTPPAPLAAPSAPSADSDAPPPERALDLRNTALDATREARTGAGTGRAVRWALPLAGAVLVAGLFFLRMLGDNRTPASSDAEIVKPHDDPPSQPIASAQSPEVVPSATASATAADSTTRPSSSASVKGSAAPSARAKQGPGEPSAPTGRRPLGELKPRD